MGETDKTTILGFNRNIFLVGLVSLLTDTSTKLVYSIMPMFLLSIGASKTTLSLIEGIAESTAALVKTMSGFFSDRIGRNKPFMVVGYAVTAIVTPVYAAVASPLQVLGLRFIERACRNFHPQNASMRRVCPGGRVPEVCQSLESEPTPGVRHEKLA